MFTTPLKLTILIFSLISYNAFAQASGCTDPQATNYDPQAQVNDGSCAYAPLAITPLSSVIFSDTLQETSGLIYWNDLLWTHNDNTDTSLYAIGQDGTIRGIVAVAGVANTDWEEIAQDDQYIYIGDFGNNSSGNRTDLHILRLAKSNIHGNLQVDTISFSYSDQESLVPCSGNTTNFDCEAFIITSDSIFLFTKRWGDKRTFLYALHKTPGIHTAMLRDSLDVQGLITGASFKEDKQMLILCGYNNFLQPFLYALYDFRETRFFGGNKRKIGITAPYAQIEGIATADGLRYYLSNEKFQQASVPPKLHLVDLTQYLSSYYAAGLDENDIGTMRIYPNPASDMLNISVSDATTGKLLTVYNALGKRIYSEKIKAPLISIPMHSSGLYLVGMENGPFLKVWVK